MRHIVNWYTSCILSYWGFLDILDDLFLMQVHSSSVCLHTPVWGQLQCSISPTLVWSCVCHQVSYLPPPSSLKLPSSSPTPLPPSSLCLDPKTSTRHHLFQNILRRSLFPNDCYFLGFHTFWRGIAFSSIIHSTHRDLNNVTIISNTFYSLKLLWNSIIPGTVAIETSCDGWFLLCGSKGSS